MKTRYTLIFMVCLLICSCYKDLSTQATTTIPDIVIKSGEDVINIAYGQNLVLSPEVSRDDGESVNFSYLWEIDLTHGSKDNRIEIGDERELSYKVGNSPSDYPYTLTLTVTDSTTSISRMQEWDVYVSSSLGEGLLVAFTRDGGQTSDISLIASKALTYGYSSDIPLITEDLYSFANGQALQGRINTMCTSVVTDGAVFNTTRVMLGTDDHLIAINPLDYKEKERDVTLFNSKETSFGTTAVFNFGDYGSGAFVGRRFFACICNFDRAYTKVPVSSKISDVFTPENLAYAKPDQGKVLIFHPDDCKFMYASILSVNGGMSAIDDPGISYSLQGAKAVAGGSFKDSVLGMILRLADGSYHLYTFDLTSLNPTATDYPLTGLIDFDKAVSVAFCDNTSIVYYCTPDKIYAIIVSGGKVALKALSWKPDSNAEKITSISQYAQNWYGTSHNSFNDYPFVLQHNRLQVVITTYNETTGEGKVYLRPFSVSTGMFTMVNNGTFGGFGEITAVATTPR